MCHYGKAKKICEDLICSKSLDGELNALIFRMPPVLNKSDSSNIGKLINLSKTPIPIISIAQGDFNKRSFISFENIKIVINKIKDLDYAFISIGGGGLISGMACVLKKYNPKIKILGVEPIYSNVMTNSIKSNKPEIFDTLKNKTIADTLAAPFAGDITFEFVKEFVDEIINVSEQEMIDSLRIMIERLKIIPEPAASACLAPILFNKIKINPNSKCLVVVCGGNIDPTVLHRVIDHGLAVDGRLWRFTATVSDRPGGMAKLTQVIADAGASVLEINHDRAFSGPEVFSTTVEVTVETADQDHIEALHKQLCEADFGVASATGCH